MSESGFERGRIFLTIIQKTGWYIKIHKFLIYHPFIYGLLWITNNRIVGLPIIGGLSLQAPLNTVLGVFDVEAQSRELIADKIRRSPIFVAFGILAHLHKKVNRALISFCGATVVSIHTNLHSKDIDQEYIKKMT